METQIRKRTIEEDVEISERTVVEGNVWIRRGTKILDGACIRGPCYIGSNTLIGNNCLIRDHSSIGNNSVIGFSSEIKHSLIADNCWFHMNYVGDSIISEDCLFGAGTITANYRFDGKNVKLKIEGKETDSGTTKLGAIIGNDCKIGINAALSPGVRIGPHSVVGPNVYLHNDLKPDKTIFIDNESYVKKDRTKTVSLGKKRQHPNK
jgi:bifunctional UDP-N-acetylglucosamine pyrophosphorylase/glucosamine-1-phosphate N-acetyltransferase